MSETQTVETKGRKVKAREPKVPCLCSRLEALENVREAEGGDLTWDAEYVTGCAGVLTSKVFAPGHDAKAVGWLLEMHAKGQEVSRMDGGVRVFADPERMALDLGGALHAKFLKGVDNLNKRDAEKSARADERKLKQEAAAERKAQAKADKEAAKATPEGE